MITIERMTDFTDQDIEDLGKLNLVFSEEASPINVEVLREVCDNPNHYVQIVARDDGQIVGSATLSVLIKALSGERVAYLEEFAVSPQTQGKGVGGKIWDEMLAWCRDNELPKMEFTSKPSRVAAQNFYLKRGAVIRETNVFRVVID